MRVKRISPLHPKAFYPPRGEKQVYLPNFTLTLLRTPHAPPHFASFLTPLYLNKLDLKDYLWHAYGLQVLGVRSYVIQAKVQEDKSSRKRPISHKWFRPRATKKMTVELAKNGPGQGPFIWPDPPTDFSPWSKATFDLAKEHQENQSEQATILKFRKAPTDGDTIADQAKALREGRARWRPSWQEYGGARVVVRRAGGAKEDGEDGEVSDAGWMHGDGGARKDQSGKEEEGKGGE